MGLQQINAIELSRYIVPYVISSGHSINHLKLQKLIYYVDAWHYAILEQPLIRDEFEAWMHGPVVRRVWDFYKGESCLYNDITVADPLDIGTIVNEEQVEVINDILDEYGNKTAYHLECLTHSEKPWKVARTGYDSSDKCTEIIPKGLMRDYYQGLLYGQAQT